MFKELALAFTIAFGAGTVATAQNTAEQPIKDGGLEECGQGALPANWGIQDEDGAQGTVAVDDTQAHSGKRSLLVNKTNSSGYLHPWISTTLKPGSYVLRIWAKAEPVQSFSMQMYDARKWSEDKPAAFQLSSRGFMEKSCSPANGEWSKFEMEFTVTETFPVSIQIGLTKQGKLWLDDIEIVPAKKSGE